MYRLTRREFLLTVGLGVTLSGKPGFSQTSDGKRKPNLLIIQTDEHNFRTLGCYRKTLPPEQAFMWGQDSVVDTPHIDWIADHGALCTKFYATTPVCSPSRASFVSGRYPQNTPVVTNNIGLSDDIVTFAEILRRTGYATGYAGKWHLEGPGRPQWAPPRKFGFEDNRYMFNRGHWKQLEDTPQGPRVKARKGKTPTYDVTGADATSFTTDWLTDKTLEFVKTHKDKPFCYMVSIPDPHGPDTVRAPYDTLYKDMTFTKPRTFDKPTKDVPSWAKPQGGGYGQSQYYGMVKCIDDNVGRILACLQETGLMEKTIVVFTSDHGDLRGEHHRQNKGVPLEASAKVPFVIYDPQKIKAGTLVKQALGTVDFLPTMLGLMDVATTGKEEGRDASDLFTGGRRSEGWKDITFVRGTGGADANWLAAFTNRYKLIVSPQDEPWLIDLVEDPDELRNFCFDAGHRDIVRDLAGELAAYGKKYHDTRAANRKIAADLQWCTEGTGQYISTA
ncbi:MAG: sulfatase [Phycisphaerae bacterium]|nr:sulfatase [Phycisphaerae bacterium]